MTADLLTSKIELLEEQIENIERSGFFTESEIDRAVVSLRSELEMYNMHLSYCDLPKSDNVLSGSDQRYNQLIKDAKSANSKYLASAKYGMSDEEYEEGRKKHIELFDQMQAKNPMDIEVVSAEILTPSNQ